MTRTFYYHILKVEISGCFEIEVHIVTGARAGAGQVDVVSQG